MNKSLSFQAQCTSVISKKKHKKLKNLNLKEIFQSIQGKTQFTSYFRNVGQ